MGGGYVELVEVYLQGAVWGKGVVKSYVIKRSSRDAYELIRTKHHDPVNSVRIRVEWYLSEHLIVLGPWILPVIIDYAHCSLFPLQHGHAQPHLPLTDLLDHFQVGGVRVRELHLEILSDARLRHRVHGQHALFVQRHELSRFLVG